MDEMTAFRKAVEAMAKREGWSTFDWAMPIDEVRAYEAKHGEYPYHHVYAYKTRTSWGEMVHVPVPGFEPDDA